MNEFELIKKLFAPFADETGLRLEDDAACWQPPADCDAVLSTDMLVMGVHFPETAPPEMVASRLVGSALSDLAAKGAEPKGALLNFAIASAWNNNDFLTRFAKTLGARLMQYNTALWGGDTTATSAASVALTVFGVVPHGTMIKRSTARAGDDIYISGTIGKGAMGLRDILAGRENKDYSEPVPRFALGQALRGVASASIDISDGLIADLTHLATASNLALAVNIEQVPLASDELSIEAQLTGGDDYEIAFAAPQAKRVHLATLERALKLPLTRIGGVSKGQGVILNPPISLTKTGYSHF